jgi:hypothetical protein
VSHTPSDVWLIADLLEACEGLLSLIDPDDDCTADPEESEIAFARSVIAKAKGG